MDLTNDELQATRDMQNLSSDEQELIRIYRKLSTIEQCLVVREMKAREYLNKGEMKND